MPAFFVNLSGLQPHDEVIRFDIHQFHLIRGIKDRIRDPFADRNMGDSCYQVIQRFQMLDIYRSVNIYACPEQFFYILISFGVPAPRRIAVGKLIDQQKLRPAF